MKTKKNRRPNLRPSPSTRKESFRLTKCIYLILVQLPRCCDSRMCCNFHYTSTYLHCRILSKMIELIHMFLHQDMSHCHLEQLCLLLHYTLDHLCIVLLQTGKKRDKFCPNKQRLEYFVKMCMTTSCCIPLSRHPVEQPKQNQRLTLEA